MIVIACNNFLYILILILNVGTYYLKIDTTNTTASSVNISIIGHDHNVSSWKYFDCISHRGKCTCGEFIQKPHVVDHDKIVNFKATCLECKELLDLRYDVANGNNVFKVSSNGSYILTNGIIVLVKEDIESYFNGTLEFYKVDNSSTTI